MAAYFTSISQPSRATYVNELREYVRRVGDRRGLSEKLVWFNVDWIEAPIAEPDWWIVAGRRARSRSFVAETVAKWD